MIWEVDLVLAIFGAGNACITNSNDVQPLRPSKKQSCLRKPRSLAEILNIGRRAFPAAYGFILGTV